MNLITNNDCITSALEKFGGRSDVSNVEFCKHLGFTENEMKYVELFWDPAFNRSMIYLSDELILNNLTNESNNGHALNHFYTRKLFRYTKGSDYVEVKSDHPLIQAYLLLYPNMGRGNFHTIKKHYLITGNCFKQLLLESTARIGREIRLYYIKVEDAAMCMKDYIMLATKLIAERAITSAENESKRAHELEYEVKNYDVIHYQEDEAKRVQFMIEQLRGFDLSTLNSYSIAYILDLNKYMLIDGINRRMYKYGRSEGIEGRVRGHKLDYKGCNLIALYVVINSRIAEGMVKDALIDHQLHLETVEVHGKDRQELFVTLPGMTICHVDNMLRKMLRLEDFPLYSNEKNRRYECVNCAKDDVPVRNVRESSRTCTKCGVLKNDRYFMSGRDLNECADCINKYRKFKRRVNEFDTHFQKFAMEKEIRDLGDQGKRKCTECDRVLPFSEYNKCNKGRFGLDARCKDCRCHPERKPGYVQKRARTIRVGASC